MNWFTGLATFLILWWLSLFVVLPIGVRGQAEAEAVEPGTEPGAPTRPNMIRKALWATGMAIAFFLLLSVILSTGWLTWERMGVIFGLGRDS